MQKQCSVYPQPGYLPEREPLNFNLNVENEPDEIKRLIYHIAEVAQDSAYHWKTFPIVPPPYVQYQQDACCPHHRLQSHDCGSCICLSVGDVHDILEEKKLRHLKINDLFTEFPDFDELHELSIERDGKPKLLNEEQLASLYSSGEFCVPSVRFPGEHHVWEISWLWLEGHDVAKTKFQSHYSKALDWLIGYPIQIVISDTTFSMFGALKSFLKGINILLHWVIGVPICHPPTYDEWIRDERSKYLVAELVLRPETVTYAEELAKDMNSFVRWFELKKFADPLIYPFQDRKSTKTLAREREARNLRIQEESIENACSSPNIIVPYIFQTPQGDRIDLRLFCRMTFEKVVHILKKIVKQETIGRFLHNRERIVSDLRAKYYSEKEIERRIRESISNEYMNRVYDRILNSGEMKDLGLGIPELVVDHIKTSLAMRRAIDKVDIALKQKFRQETGVLQIAHPILSATRWWSEREEKYIMSELKSQIRWDAHNEAIFLCRSQGLEQSAYFLQRDLAFLREREPMLRSEVRKVAECRPKPKYRTKTEFRIWLPKNFRVYRIAPEVIERIPTKVEPLGDQLTNVGGSQDMSSLLRYPSYRFCEKNRYFISTSFYGWKMCVAVLRIVATVANEAHRCCDLFWNHNFGARFLFSQKIFHSGFMMDQERGCLVPNVFNPIHPARQIIRELVAAIFRTEEAHTDGTNVQAELNRGRTEPDGRQTEPDRRQIELNGGRTEVNREQAEVNRGRTQPISGRTKDNCGQTAPNRAQIGTDRSRAGPNHGHTNASNYANIVLRAGTSAILGIGFFGVCLIYWFGLLLRLIASPFVATLGIALKFLSAGFFFDGEKRVTKNPTCIFLQAFGLMARGIFIACFATCVMICAVAWGFSRHFLGATLVYVIRLIWDSISYHFLIKNKMTVPAWDTYVLQRYRGPGLNQKFCWRISPEQALAAFEGKLEMEELFAYKKQMKDLIREPICDFKKFTTTCLAPFYVKLCEEGLVEDLEREAKSFNEALDKRLENRLRYLQTGLSDDNRQKIRMTAYALKIAIYQGASMLETFFPNHVLSRLSVPENEYWAERNLAPRDWLSLSAQLYVEIFGPQFVAPLAASERSYWLRPSARVEMRPYTNMVARLRLPDESELEKRNGNPRPDTPRMDLFIYCRGPNFELQVDVFSAHIVLRTRLDETDSGQEENVIRNDELTIPLNVPHPTHIVSILLHREGFWEPQFHSKSYQRVVRLIRNRVKEVLLMPSPDRAPCQNLINEVSGEPNAPYFYDERSDYNALPPTIKEGDEEEDEEVEVESAEWDHPSSVFDSPSPNRSFALWPITFTPSAGGRRPKTQSPYVELASPEDDQLDESDFERSGNFYDDYGTRV